MWTRYKGVPEGGQWWWHNQTTGQFFLERATLVPFTECAWTDPSKSYESIKSAINTVVALDGKIDNHLQTWGIGLQDLKAGFGRFSGGRFGQAGRMKAEHDGVDQASSETIAMWLGLFWVRKRQEPNIDVYRELKHSVVEAPCVFITDRAATLVTMMRESQRSQPDEWTQSAGFRTCMLIAAYELGQNFSY